MSSAPPVNPTPGSGAGDLYQDGPSSSDQFIRRWALTLIGTGGQEWTLSDSEQVNAASGGTTTIQDPLRITFHTHQARTESRGHAEVTIYNLSLKHPVSGLRQMYNRLILRAGYRSGRFATIFNGTIIDFRQGRAPSLVETYLRITAQDGDIPYNVATVNATYNSGTTATDAVKGIANQMVQLGATLGKIVNMPQTPFIRARTYFGMAVDSILKHGQPSIQNGTLNISPTNSSFTVGDPVQVNGKTGLIGMARITGPNGVEFECLLNPTLQVGTTVVLNNASINVASGLANSDGAAPPGNTATQGPGNTQLGFFVDPSADGTYLALLIEHTGDSRGNEWQTHVLAWPNGAQVSPPAGGMLKELGPSLGQVATQIATPSLPPDVIDSKIAGSP